MIGFDTEILKKNQACIDIICKAFGVSEPDLYNPPSRQRKYVDARRSLIYFMVEMGLGYTEIGNRLSMDHSNAIYHYNKFKDIAINGTNKDVKENIDTLLFGFIPEDNLLDSLLNAIFVTDFGMVNMEKTKENFKKLIDKRL